MQPKTVVAVLHWHCRLFESCASACCWLSHPHATCKAKQALEQAKITPSHSQAERCACIRPLCTRRPTRPHHTADHTRSEPVTCFPQPHLCAGPRGGPRPRQGGRCRARWAQREVAARPPAGSACRGAPPSEAPGLPEPRAAGSPRSCHAGAGAAPPAALPRASLHTGGGDLTACCRLMAGCQGFAFPDGLACQGQPTEGVVKRCSQGGRTGMDGEPKQVCLVACLSRGAKAQGRHEGSCVRLLAKGWA